MPTASSHTTSAKKSVSSYVLQSIANSAYRVPNDIWERIDKVLDELEKKEAKRREE